MPAGARAPPTQSRRGVESWTLPFAVWMPISQTEMDETRSPLSRRARSNLFTLAGGNRSALPKPFSVAGQSS
jgi:hypothetical protein